MFDDDSARDSTRADTADLADLAPDLAADLHALRALTDSLTHRDVDLDGRQAAVVAAELARATSRLSLARVALLPVIDADGLWAVDGTRSFPLWVAREHRVAVHTARAQVRLARTLRDHLPATATAAAAGDITAEQAQILATLAPTTDQRRDLLADPEQECNEEFLVQQARGLSVDETRVLARQWAAYADPDADDRGYVESCDREHLQVARLGDMYDVCGQLTVEHGQLLKAALAAVTPAKAPDDQRSPSQRRAQALADLARIALEHDSTAAGRTPSGHLSVLVDYPTMAALAQATTDRTDRTDQEPVQGTLPGTPGTPGAATKRHPHLPGRRTDSANRTPPMLTAAMLTGQAIAGGPQLADRTPIPRLLLDRLACGGALQRFVFGPHSQVLDVGRTERCFTRARRAAIAARDKHCQHPGCTAPPALCEYHHVRHWTRDHGTTSVDNGILLCWHHHDLLHRRGTTIQRRGHRWVFTDSHGKRITAGHDHDDDGPPTTRAG